MRFLDLAGSERHRRIGFAAALFPVLAAVFPLSVAGRFAENQVLLTVLLLLGGLSWVVATSLAVRGAGDLRLVVAGAIALRILAWSGQAELSDDAYRYLWEGEVVLEGASPYSFAPDSKAGQEAGLAEELRGKHPELFSRLNHANVRAAYPPLAQAVGALVAGLCRWLDVEPETTGVRILRALSGACDLLVIWPLARLLERARMPRALAVVWGWCPLPAIEFAGTGHLDSLGILLLLGALAAAPARKEDRTRPEDDRVGFVALALLSAGILMKYLPALVLPWFLRGRRTIARGACVAVLCAVGFAPLLWLRGSISDVFSGLGEYAFRWESASLLHRWIEPCFDGFFDRDETWSDPRRLARITEAIAWLVVAFVVVRRERDPLRGVGALIGAWLVLSPTLHPWYLCWILPFVGWRAPSAWFWPVLVAPLFYWPLHGWQSTGIWVEPPWLWPVVALPCFSLLALERFSRKRRLPGGTATTP